MMTDIATSVIRSLLMRKDDDNFMNLSALNGSIRRNGRRRDPAPEPDLICLSHLRWDFAYQRAQHLMSRFARQQRVFFFEEPLWSDAGPRLRTRTCPASSVVVATPELPHGLPVAERELELRWLLRNSWTTRRSKTRCSGSIRQ